MNAQMRYFRAVAAGLMRDALAVWGDIWCARSDPRTPDEILEGVPEPKDEIPECGWAELREKLHILRHYLEQVRRFCDGQI